MYELTDVGRDRLEYLIKTNDIKRMEYFLLSLIDNDELDIYLKTLVIGTSKRDLIMSSLRGLEGLGYIG